MKNKRLILIVSLIPSLLLCPPKKSKGCTVEELALLATFESQVKEVKNERPVQARHELSANTEGLHQKRSNRNVSLKEAAQLFELAGMFLDKKTPNCLLKINRAAHSSMQAYKGLLEFNQGNKTVD